MGKIQVTVLKLKESIFSLDFEICLYYYIVLNREFVSIMPFCKHVLAKVILVPCFMKINS